MTKYIRIILLACLASCIILLLLSIPTFAAVISPYQIKDRMEITIAKFRGSANSPNPQILEFGIVIDKIHINAPIIANVNPNSEYIYNSALKGGVAHFSGTSLPGQRANVVLFGHSSALIALGRYDSVFADLPQLNFGDSINIYYQNKIHTYKVINHKIVEANDSSVILPTNMEQLTLITCWPIGSSAKRFVVIASPV